MGEEDVGKIEDQRENFRSRIFSIVTEVDPGHRLDDGS
jgi:hypothetical protein